MAWNGDRLVGAYLCVRVCVYVCVCVCVCVQIIHTSAAHDGQIYVSSANWILMILTIAVVGGFQADSTKMGNAYGT